MTKKNVRACPPEEHQFKKGLSGNPRGRPKKAKAVSPETAISKIAATTFQSHKNGRVRELTPDELALSSILNAAFSGDKTAQREVLRWITKRAVYRDKQRSKQRGVAVDFLIESVPRQTANAALQLLNIISINLEESDLENSYIYYELEPEAVQSALNLRRGGTKLSKEALSWILAYTRDSAAVKLPRRHKT